MASEIASPIHDSIATGFVNFESLPHMSSIGKHQEEVIVWDDPPSSPFDSEVAESRKSSTRLVSSKSDAEVDAIFEDVYDDTQENRELQYNMTSCIDEKENNDPTELTLTAAQKFSTPMKSMMGTECHGTALRERDNSMMPPPSTTKRPAQTFTKKASAFSSSQIGTTTSSAVQPVKSSNWRDPPRVPDDRDIVGEETNIDDTCFSTFSAVPEMTIFAKLGENRHSPLKGQPVCIETVYGSCVLPLTLLTDTNFTTRYATHNAQRACRFSLPLPNSS